MQRIRERFVPKPNVARHPRPAPPMGAPSAIEPQQGGIGLHNRFLPLRYGLKSTIASTRRPLPKITCGSRTGQAGRLTRADFNYYPLVMRSVGLKRLNNRLSKYVRLAASGETILVTDRDRVLAELVPPREIREPALADASLDAAVRSGVLAGPALSGSAPPPRPEPVATLEEILAELDEDRRDRCSISIRR